MQEPNNRIGTYALKRIIGEGNFGVVWLAEDCRPASRRQVAIKILKEQDAKAILKEVFVWAKLDKHPNVLPIIEADVFTTQHGEYTIIISPYVHDGSLETLMKGRALGAGAAVDITCGILDGLEYLHSRSIVHRDLKPANILLDCGVPLIADFGIARVLDFDSEAKSGVIAGTPLYMAPEAFEGYRTHWTDVWSAAVICYQMVTGRLPFPDAAAIQRFDVRLLPLPDSVPRKLSQILARALHKDTTFRYESAAALRDALLRMGGGRRAQDFTRSHQEEIETLPAAPAAAHGQAPVATAPPMTVPAEASPTPAPRAVNELMLEAETIRVRDGEISNINDEGGASGAAEGTAEGHNRTVVKAKDFIAEGTLSISNHRITKRDG